MESAMGRTARAICRLLWRLCMPLTNICLQQRIASNTAPSSSHKDITMSGILATIYGAWFFWAFTWKNAIRFSFSVINTEVIDCASRS
jgi:hypothetical protein